MAEELPALARVLGQAIELLEGERRELAELNGPEDDASRIGAMLAYLEKSALAGRRAQRAAQNGDLDAANIAIGESDSAAAQARHEARNLGATICAKP